MSETSEASKASEAHGEDNDVVVRRLLGAEGETFQKAGDSRSDDQPPLRTPDSMMEHLIHKKKTHAGRPIGGALKENVPPTDGRGTLSSDRGPSPMGERRILQEILSTSGADELDTSQEILPGPEKKVSETKIFKLKEVNLEVSAMMVSPKPKSQGDEKSSMDCSAGGSYEIIIHGAKTGTPKSKRDPRDNLGKFHPMLVATSVPDLWAFDAFIGRSGAFFTEETAKTKSYKCEEKFILPGEDDESDLEKSEDLDSAEDFLNLSAGVNAMGGSVCKGHFKIQKLSNQIYRVKTSSDSMCKRCLVMIPVPGFTPCQALRLLKDQLDIEPFLEEVDDEKSAYKVAWIHKRFGTLITAEYKDVLTLSKFDDCVSIAVEVGSRIMKRDSMFFPFAYLVGNDLSTQDIEEFLKSVIEKCNLSTCSYVFTSNNHEMFAGICSSCFWDGVKVLPNFFTVIEQLRESWLGRNLDICDFNNALGFASYIKNVREALCKKVIAQAYPSVEKALEDSLGLDYCELPNIKQIIKVAEDYVRNIGEADIFDLEYDKLSTEEDYVLSLEFISKQPFETKVRYLDNCSLFRGNHIILMMPDFVN